MLEQTRQNAGSFALWTVLALCLAAGAVSVANPELTPWAFLAVGLAGLAALWVIRFDITLWFWVWVLSYGLLDRQFLHLQLAGLPNMTIPRFIALGAFASFGIYFCTHRRLVKLQSPLHWMIIAFLGYVAINASMFGWTASSEVGRTWPYYRFLEPLLLPIMLYFLVVSSLRSRRQILTALVPLVIYGWYALYIGYLQYAAIRGWEGARSLIWPSYINMPSWGSNYGIHFDRARGAYALSNPQAVLLIQLLFVDLFLIRRIQGPLKLMLIVQAILIPPAVFFTGLRSAYLALLLCGAVWCIWGGRLRLGKVKLAMIALVVVIACSYAWENLLTRDRATGGVGQIQETQARLVLAQQAVEIAKEHPLTGVGFGHFLDYQLALNRDPGSPHANIFSVLTQHNLFLAILAETGIIGLILIVTVFVMLFGQIMRLYRRLPLVNGGWLSRDLVIVGFIAMLNYLINAMFVDPLWDPASNALFWGFMALMVGYNRLVEPASLDLASKQAIGPEPLCRCSGAC